jgi:2-dehydro-3-deoxygluconokinase
VNILPPFIQPGIRDLDDSYLARAKALHTHPFDFDVCLHCARLMNENGGLFSLDLELQRVRNMPASNLNELLALTDFLFCNDLTLAHLVPETEVGKAAGILQARGPRMVVVTLGQKGSIAVDPRGKMFRVSPPEADAVDATGAGDCFAAAFLYGYMKQWPLKKILHYASVAAAGVVTRIGARTGQPTLREFLLLGRSVPITRAWRK